MTDRDRLGQKIRVAYEKWNRGEAVAAWAEPVADALLAEGVTLPPQPAGPVTSEATAEKWLGIRSEDMDSCLTVVEEVRRDMDRILPNLARDHGLLTPAEVERRARGWWQGGRGGFPELIAALTRAEG